MKLPGAGHAVVDLNKLSDYCLNLMHPRGRHKARVFTSALSITQVEAEFLRGALPQAALTCDAAPGEEDEYGCRYIIDFDCIRGHRRAIVPRLTTCYVLSD